MARARRRQPAWELPLVASVLEMLRTVFPSFEVEWRAGAAAAAGDGDEPEVHSAGRKEHAEGRPSEGTAHQRRKAGRSRQRQAPRARPVDADPALLRNYAQLGIPFDADLAAVRSAWRRLVRKFHPDLHASEPELERRGTERIKEINRAYEELRRRLDKGGLRSAMDDTCHRNTATRRRYEHA